jgi:endoglucanase
VSKQTFLKDLKDNLSILNQRIGLRTGIHYFLPPFEWYNDSISAWTKEMGMTLVNYTPGTLTHADYTTPGEKNYRDSKTILQSIITREALHPNGLNGFILLMHVGTDPSRTDKFYHRLLELVRWLKENNYEPVRIDELL